MTQSEQLVLFPSIIPPDTPLGNFACSQPAAVPAALPPIPANPAEHYKRFGVTAKKYVAALEWLADNNETFVDLEAKENDLENAGDVAGAAETREQIDRTIADHFAHERLCKEFEALLRQKEWPFVCVDEAKRAIFGGSGIEAFDFLVYSQTGANLLVSLHDGPVSREDIDAMREWESIFGKDFQAVFISRLDDGWVCQSMPDAASKMQRLELAAML